MHISERGLRLIEQFEGFRSKRYLDGGGVPTIGFGTTASVVSPVPETCTFEQAQEWLKLEVERDVEPAINALGIHFNPNEFDALCSWGYNCGVREFDRNHRIGSLLKNRQWQGAWGYMKQYIHDARGSVEPGLVTRRHLEWILFFTKWQDPDPHHYLRFDSVVRDLGSGHKGSERDIVEEYDIKRRHPFIHRPRLATLRRDLGVLASRLEAVMEWNPEGNADNHRGWRLDGLERRRNGDKVVS